MGGVGNGDAEEDSHRDLKLGAAAMRGEPHSFGAAFTLRFRKQESKV